MGMCLHAPNANPLHTTCAITPATSRTTSALPPALLTSSSQHRDAPVGFGVLTILDTRPSMRQRVRLTSTRPPAMSTQCTTGNPPGCASFATIDAFSVQGLSISTARSVLIIIINGNLSGVWRRLSARRSVRRGNTSLSITQPPGPTSQNATIAMRVVNSAKHILTTVRSAKPTPTHLQTMATSMSTMTPSVSACKHAKCRRAPPPRSDTMAAFKP